MSFACFSNTINHSVKPDFEIEQDYPEYWDFFIKYQTDRMKRWFEMIIDHTDRQKLNPIYFVRYEDLVDDMEGPTMGIMEYLLDLDTL